MKQLDGIFGSERTGGYEACLAPERGRSAKETSARGTSSA